MIYKFEDYDTIMEVELFNEDNSGELIDKVDFTITQEKGFFNVRLKKKDVFMLIGALHLLHKEMK
jgi:hypothetical protein